MKASRTVDIEVPDDSILAHKKLEIRNVRQMKQKHLRMLQKVMRRGKALNAADVDPDEVFELMDLLSGALEGLLVGWSAEDIQELTLDEMILIFNQLDASKRFAIPNGRLPNSTPRSAATTVASAPTGSTRSSSRGSGAAGRAKRTASQPSGS